MTVLSSSSQGIELFGKNSSSKTTPGQEESKLFGEDGFTFGDILDIVNPLQHIPIVSTIYRNITGDTIAPAMKVAGGALFGGPLGAAVSMVASVFQSQNKVASDNPDSPYTALQQSTSTPATVANTTIQKSSNSISINDYLPNNAALIGQTDYSKPITQQVDNSAQSTRTNDKQTSQDKIKETYTDTNTRKRRHVYQPGDGIVNLAHKAAKHYTDTHNAQKPSANNIDIVIGSSLDKS